MTTVARDNNLLTEIGDSLDSLGLQQGNREQLIRCFGTILLYLRSIGSSTSYRFIEIILDEIASIALIEEKRSIDTARVRECAAKIQSLIFNATGDAAMATKLIKKSAQPIPTNGKRIIRHLLQRIPNLGTILEIAAHSDLMIVNKIAEKADLRFDHLHEVNGLPDVAPWTRATLHTIIINALGMGPFAHYFINFVSTIARANLGIIAIIAHDKDLFINSVSELDMFQLDDYNISIFTTAEKKIAAIIDMLPQSERDIK